MFMTLVLIMMLAADDILDIHDYLMGNNDIL